jgi:hypothetical protein
LDETAEQSGHNVTVVIGPVREDPIEKPTPGRPKVGKGLATSCGEASLAHATVRWQVEPLQQAGSFQLGHLPAYCGVIVHQVTIMTRIIEEHRKSRNCWAERMSGSVHRARFTSPGRIGKPVRHARI